MMRMGIVGAENSHARNMAKNLNVDKHVRGFRVTHLWGETRKFARQTAQVGEIPNIVSRPKDMLGQVDCVMVCHRDGGPHVAAARPFVKAGLPVFIDKPLSTSLAQAKSLMRLRKETGAPIVSSSALPLQRCARETRQELGKLGTLHWLHLSGSGDWRSKYGGIFFYGIHQADLLVELVGTDARHVWMTTNRDRTNILVNFPDGLTAVLSVVPGARGWTVDARGDKGMLQKPFTMDPNSHLVTARLVTRMFRTGVEPIEQTRMLAPVALLEAARKSRERGRRVAVGRL